MQRETSKDASYRNGEVSILREPMSRGQRLARRFKNVLRCEWCNKWTEVSSKRWQKLRSEDKLFPSKYVFYCARPRCKNERAEYIVPS